MTADRGCDVVTADRGCDVWHAAIADFYIVVVEQFCERGVLEMAINHIPYFSGCKSTFYD